MMYYQASRGVKEKQKKTTIRKIRMKLARGRHYREKERRAKERRSEYKIVERERSEAWFEARRSNSSLTIQNVLSGGRCSLVGDAHVEYRGKREPEAQRRQAKAKAKAKAVQIVRNY